MKIFVSCSTSNAMNNIFKEQAKIIGIELGKLDCELVFGSSTNGLLGIIYEEFKKSKNDITVVVPKELVGDLTEVECTNKIIVNDVMNHPAGLIEYCDLILALPGGMGTLAELSLALHTRRFLHKKPIIIVNESDYFTDLISFFKKQVKEKCLYPEDLNIFEEVKTAEEAIIKIKKTIQEKAI